MKRSANQILQNVPKKHIDKCERETLEGVACLAPSLVKIHLNKSQCVSFCFTHFQDSILSLVKVLLLTTMDVHSLQDKQNIEISHVEIIDKNVKLRIFWIHDSIMVDDAILGREKMTNIELLKLPNLENPRLVAVFVSSEISKIDNISSIYSMYKDVFLSESSFEIEKSKVIFQLKIETPKHPLIQDCEDRMGRGSSCFESLFVREGYPECIGYCNLHIMDHMRALFQMFEDGLQFELQNNEIFQFDIVSIENNGVDGQIWNWQSNELELSNGEIREVSFHQLFDLVASSIFQITFTVACEGVEIEKEDVQVISGIFKGENEFLDEDQFNFIEEGVQVQLQINENQPVPELKNCKLREDCLFDCNGVIVGDLPEMEKRKELLNAQERCYKKNSIHARRSEVKRYADEKHQDLEDEDYEGPEVFNVQKSNMVLRPNTCKEDNVDVFKSIPHLDVLRKSLEDNLQETIYFRKKLGQGEYGIVMLICLPKKGNIVFALKFTQFRHANTKNGNLKQEFEMQSRFFDIGLAPKPILYSEFPNYIVMNKVDGILGNWLNEKDRSFKELDLIVSNIINIIFQLSLNGLSHNDMHFDNIAIRFDGYGLYLIDFGFAKMGANPHMELAQLIRTAHDLHFQNNRRNFDYIGQQLLIVYAKNFPVDKMLNFNKLPFDEIEN